MSEPTDPVIDFLDWLDDQPDVSLIRFDPPGRGGGYERVDLYTTYSRYRAQRGV